MKDLSWLTVEFLNQRYTYNPNTGDLLSHYTGKPIRDRRGRGNNYYRVSLRANKKRHSIAAHTICFILMTGRQPNCTIDHINGNGLDNRWVNLREASHSQQALNRKIRSNNTSGYRGVSFDKEHNKYRAYIHIKGKRVNLGRFKCKHEAALAYNKKAIEYVDPEFRRLNQIGENDD